MAQEVESSQCSVCVAGVKWSVSDSTYRDTDTNTDMDTDMHVCARLI